MEEKSGNENLIDNLIKLGLNPETHIKNESAVLATKDRYANSKYVLASVTDSIYFLAYDSGRSYPSTGLYASIDLPDEAEYIVYKRSWFDKFIFFNRKKVGIDYIDNKLTISSSNWIPKKELNAESVDLFLRINKKSNPYSLILQNDYLPMIPMFKDKKIIGLETRTWLYKKEDLKILLESGNTLLQKIKNKL
ncbi:MAG: hypothetical protein CVT94_05950 [Bacteroidetes bacterium HGW-Bacteroidetes-11]|jgi:hypothetical protein|nr:MAG: hypothetical protein CVT94_05950 [Bacteroidetes bacterium HGW-Bacteroidetes-11]